jgi:hypothetical protein
MEINKPDKGVFKGIGSLDQYHPNNKKYFPRIRNIHQFDYTHHHRNDYTTSFQKFFTPNKNHTSLMERVKKNPNQSEVQLGTDPHNYLSSVSKTDYKHFDKAVPPKQIRQKEEGVYLGNESKDNHFVTTTMDKFGRVDEKNRTNVTFKNRGISRFNPITGESRQLNFGYEDFEMNRKNNYRANNFSVIPQKNERIDIISGRKLTFQ